MKSEIVIGIIAIQNKSPPREPITELANAKDGDYFKGTVKIVRRAQPGPVVFLVTDGTKMIDAVTKDSPFQTDEVVYLQGKVSERQGALQIEIDRMEKSGLVRRIPDSEDRRINYIEMTEKGRETLEKAHAVYHKRLDEIMSPLSESDNRQIIALHEAIRKQLWDGNR